MNRNFLENKSIHIAIFIIGILFSYWMAHTLSLHYDHRQMLEKAFHLLNTGEWTHFGSRGTGVGYVPGTLLTALYGLPLFIFKSPYASFTLLLLFHVVGFLLFYFPVRKIFGVTTAAFLLLLFWLSPWRLEQTELYNPGYLFLFSGIHFWTCYQLRSAAKFWPTVLHVVGIGLCAQIHFSVVILIMASLLLWLFKMVKPNIKGILVGVALVALTLLPYFLSLSTRPEAGIHVDDSSGFFLGRNFLYVYPVIKALIYWLRYSSLYFARHIFTDVHFNYIEIEYLKSSLSIMFHFLKWPIAAASLVVSIKAHWSLLQKLRPLSWSLKMDRGISFDDKTWVFHYGLFLLLGMLLAAGLSPVEFNHWHLILCFPASALLMSVWLTHYSGWKLKPIFCGLLCYFLIYNSLIAMGSRMHSLGNNYHKEVIEHFEKK